MRKDQICILTDREVGRFLYHDLNPSCEEHEHCTVQAAMIGILDDVYEFVDADNRPWVTEAKLHTLRVMPSGGIPVAQRVRGNSMKHIQEAR